MRSVARSFAGDGPANTACTRRRSVNPEAPDLVANQAREAPVSCGVSTSLAFGGNDAALVMRWLTRA